MLKKLLAVVGLLIVLLIAAVAVLTFTTPTEFKFGREIVINKPKADVLNYVKMVKNQNDWGPWIKKDPNIKLNYKGTDGEPGFVESWESSVEDVGVGEQELKSITADSVRSELRFKKPMESVNYSDITLEEVSPTQTKVKWALSGSFPRPMNIMLRVMDIDAAVGKDFEAGLKNLKEIMEKN